MNLVFPSAHCLQPRLKRLLVGLTSEVKKWEESMREAQDNADVENFLKTAAMEPREPTESSVKKVEQAQTV